MRTPPSGSVGAGVALPPALEAECPLAAKSGWAFSAIGAKTSDGGAGTGGTGTRATRPAVMGCGGVCGSKSCTTAKPASTGTSSAGNRAGLPAAGRDKGNGGFKLNVQIAGAAGDEGILGADGQGGDDERGSRVLDAGQKAGELIG